MAQSKSVEEAKAQLLIATELEVGTTYTIILEFAEQVGALDGEGAAKCHHFVMAIRTWDSNKECLKSSSSSDLSELTTTPDSEPQTMTVSIKKKGDRRDLNISGSGRADLQITLDYSDSFYRAEMSLKPKDAGSDDGSSISGSDSEDIEALNEAARHITPANVDFSKKQSTTYLFTNIFSGKYEMKFRQRFKGSDCASSVTVTIRSWDSASS